MLQLNFLGLGLLLFCLPHLMVGPYDVPDYRSGATGMCSLPNSTLSQSCKSDNAGTKWYYMMIFAIAQFIHGAGICPLYSLVPVYLDENVEMKHLPIYLALLYVSALIGPGVGTLLGGQFLSVFVDIEQVYISPCILTVFFKDFPTKSNERTKYFCE
jgi:MFS family permease